MRMRGTASRQLRLWLYRGIRAVAVRLLASWQAKARAHTKAHLHHIQELSFLRSIHAERKEAALRLLRAVIAHDSRSQISRCLARWRKDCRQSDGVNRTKAELIHLEVKMLNELEATREDFLSQREHVAITTRAERKQIALGQMQHIISNMLLHGLRRRLATFRHNRLKQQGMGQLRQIRSRAQAVQQASAVNLLALMQRGQVTREQVAILVQWRLNTGSNKRQLHFVMQKAIHDAGMKSSAVRQMRMALRRIVHGVVGHCVEYWKLGVMQAGHDMEIALLAETSQYQEQYRLEVLRLNQRVAELEPLEAFLTNTAGTYQ